MYISLTMYPKYRFVSISSYKTHPKQVLERPIYLSRHGESEYNELGKIGGNSALSQEGEKYASKLAKWVHVNVAGLTEEGTFLPGQKTASHARLLTSSLKRTNDTARHIKHPVQEDGWVTMRKRVWRNLDEIYAGSFDGMTYEEVRVKAPSDFEERLGDKLRYRYPGGESYLDVIERIEPVIQEIERSRDPVFIVGHQGILRIIYSYFMGKDREEAPFVKIPLNNIIELVPGTYKCEEKIHRLLPPNANENAPSVYLD